MATVIGSKDRERDSNDMGHNNNRRFLQTVEETGEPRRGSFRMPATVENGIGGTWEGGPFGRLEECPSSERVFQMGIAMDTGYFKVRAHCD